MNGNGCMGGLSVLGIGMGVWKNGNGYVEA